MVLSMDRWVGKVAVVTGASSGIGAAIAEQLVEKGLKVAALARRKDRLEGLVKKLAGKKGKLFPVQTDITKEEDILNAFKWIKENLGPVHILANNAGSRKFPEFLSDGDTKTWVNTFQVNVIGLSIATREAIKDMRANNVDGHIIHINSIGGHSIGNFPGINVYPASKYAVTALAETLRLELNALKSKIKITSLSPGLVDTEIIPAALEANIKTYFEQGQILEAEQIADAVVYVLSTPPHVQVAALARRKDRLEALSKKLAGKKGKLFPVQTDITKEEDILNAFKWIKENLGPVHILVNNAGFGKMPEFLSDGDTKTWVNTFQVNVIGLSIATREAIKDMRANNVDGHIIHINSIGGHSIGNFPGINVYPASKYAVTALAETLRLELNALKSKIKITSLSPGLVDTEIIPAALRANIKTYYEQGQILEGEQIADAVVYVLSTPPHVQIQELMIRPVIDFQL